MRVFVLPGPRCCGCVCCLRPVRVPRPRIGCVTPPRVSERRQELYALRVSTRDALLSSGRRAAVEEVEGADLGKSKPVFQEDSKKK